SNLGQRAARDLSKADVERAIGNSRTYLAGGLAALFAVLFVVLFILLGPAPFRSLLGRAFAPFARNDIATRTQVTILRPEGGDAVATIGNPVTIVAYVDGRLPDPKAKDAPCLLFRYDPSEPYTQRYLQADESSREWAATISPPDVRNGFWYLVSAGDAVTPEYRISARAALNIIEFETTYRYRPYVGKPQRTEWKTRKIEAHEGTEVTVLARTNREVAGGWLDHEPEG